MVNLNEKGLPIDSSDSDNSLTIKPVVKNPFNIFSPISFTTKKETPKIENTKEGTSLSDIRKKVGNLNINPFKKVSQKEETKETTDIFKDMKYNPDKNTDDIIHDIFGSSNSDKSTTSISQKSNDKSTMDVLFDVFGDSDSDSSDSINPKKKSPKKKTPKKTPRKTPRKTPKKTPRKTPKKVSKNQRKRKSKPKKKKL